MEVVCSGRGSGSVNMGVHAPCQLTPMPPPSSLDFGGIFLVTLLFLGLVWYDFKPLGLLAIMHGGTEAGETRKSGYTTSMFILKKGTPCYIAQRSQSLPELHQTES